MAYSGKHADENGMRGPLERAVGQGCLVLRHIQLSKAVNRTLNEVVIMKLSSINGSSQLEVMKLTKRNKIDFVLHGNDMI